MASRLLPLKLSEFLILPDQELEIWRLGRRRIKERRSSAFISLKVYLYCNQRLENSWKFPNNIHEASLTSSNLRDLHVIITHMLSIDSFLGCKVIFLICHLISGISLNLFGNLLVLIIITHVISPSCLLCWLSIAWSPS